MLNVGPWFIWAPEQSNQCSGVLNIGQAGSLDDLNSYYFNIATASFSIASSSCWIATT